MRKTIEVELTGITPLLMHSDRYANPLDPDTQAHKKLTSNRKKTEENQVEIARSEYMGGMYHDEQSGPYIPTQNIRGALIGGAKLDKLGRQAARSVYVLDARVPLRYVGPRSREELWANPAFVDCRSVVVSRARIMRYRPKFDGWSLRISLQYNPEDLEEGQLLTALSKAGDLIGLCDYRPEKGGTFGRFRVELLT